MGGWVRIPSYCISIGDSVHVDGTGHSRPVAVVPGSTAALATCLGSDRDRSACVQWCDVVGGHLNLLCDETRCVFYYISFIYLTRLCTNCIRSTFDELKLYLEDPVRHTFQNGPSSAEPVHPHVKRAYSAALYNRGCQQSARSRPFIARPPSLSPSPGCPCAALQTAGMVSIRRAIHDLLKVQDANLHCLPENYQLKYYYYVLSWPPLYAAEDHKRHVVGALAKMDEDTKGESRTAYNEPRGRSHARKRGIATKLMRATARAMQECFQAKFCPCC